MDEVAAHGLHAQQLRKLGEVQQPVGVPGGPVRVISVGDPVDDVVRLGRFVEELGERHAATI